MDYSREWFLKCNYSLILVFFILGTNFSGGECFADQFANFLKQQFSHSSEPSSASSASLAAAAASSVASPHQKPTTSLSSLISELYLYVFRIGQQSSITFSVSIYLGASDCSSGLFRNSFRNRLEIRQIVYDKVFLVGMEALQNDFFHWDIRLANILHDIPIRKIYLIDWESGLSLAHITTKNIFECSALVSTLLGRFQHRRKIPAAVYICEQLVELANEL